MSVFARLTGVRGKPGRQRRWLDAVLFNRATAGVGACVTLLVVLGCMSISIGGHSSEEAKPCPDDGGLRAQEGKFPIRPGAEQIVYYPAPYSSPPNLELEDSQGFCEIIEQKETYFRVRFRRDFLTSQQSLTWKARGMRAAPAAPPTLETVPAGASLPATPVSATATPQQ
jgi:hypothetical protein